jgi:hypothetical protein
MHKANGIIFFLLNSEVETESTISASVPIYRRGQRLVAIGAVKHSERRRSS